MSNVLVTRKRSVTSEEWMQLAMIVVIAVIFIVCLFAIGGKHG